MQHLAGIVYSQDYPGFQRGAGMALTYLIRLAPLAFIPDRRTRSSVTPSPPVVRSGLSDFTPTRNVPHASPDPKVDSIHSNSTLKTWALTVDLSTRLRML